jgi:site-specific DNA-adenine methylase
MIKENVPTYFWTERLSNRLTFNNQNAFLMHLEWVQHLERTCYSAIRLNIKFSYNMECRRRKNCSSSDTLIMFSALPQNANIQKNN